MHPSKATPGSTLASAWKSDVLPGFEQCTLQGLHSPEGAIEATLVRKRSAQESTKAVLYVHGFVDYFFQTHLAEFFNQLGFHFYAVDLRRHGRSMRAGQWPNYTAGINEYLSDMDAAVAVMREQEGVDWLMVNGHSTGGLVAALHAHRGARKAQVDAVYLNSPFLDMNIPSWQVHTVEPLMAAIGGFAPSMKLPGLSPVYGQSVHASQHGEWNFNLAWKPLEGFPVYAGWFRAIHAAHAEVAKGLKVTCPVLVLHAARSAWPKVWSEDVMSADTVLNVADIQRLSPGLGNKVEVHPVQGGMHDLALSRQAPRDMAFGHVRKWLMRIGALEATESAWAPL